MMEFLIEFKSTVEAKINPNVSKITDFEGPEYEIIIGQIIKHIFCLVEKWYHVKRVY